MRRFDRMRRAALGLGLALAVMPPALALNIELGGGLEAEYSSNVLRSDSNEQDDLIGTIWAGMTLSENSRTLSAEIAAAADAEMYMNDTLSDDVLLSLAALVDWAILPQRLHWHLEDYYQQTQVSPFEAASPDNREDTNVFWTGPDLIFRLAQLYALELGGRYGHYYYADTGGDNERLAASARLTRRLSSMSELYLEGSHMTVEYDNEGELGLEGVPYADFDRTDVFAGWAYEAVRTELRLELGNTRIKRSGLDDADGFLGALSVRRRLPQEGTLGLRLLSQYTEGSSDLLSTGGGRLRADPADEAAIHDILYEIYAELFYTGHWRGADLGVRLFYRDEDYEIAPLDRVNYGLRLDVGTRLAPSWTGGVYAAYRHRDYDQLDRTDHDLTVGVGAAYAFTRRVSLDLDLHHNLRDSRAAGFDFNETVAIIRLNYGARPAWSER